MKIICGTDFSMHAVEAATVAAGLAVRFGEPLVLVHVVEAEKPKDDLPAWESLDAEVRHRLSEEAERLRGLGATVEVELLQGSADHVLVEAANRPGMRLLVMSSVGRIAPSRFLVPSVAERTVEACHIPTLVVRASGGFSEWARGERALKILVGYDFSTTADSALNWVRELRERGPCEVVVAHIAHSDSTRNEQEPGDTTAATALGEDQLAERVQVILGGDGVEVEYEAGSRRPETYLLAIAKEVSSDLIVVGTHQRHGLERLWLGSVSRAVLRDALASVAIIPKSRSEVSATPV